MGAPCRVSLLVAIAANRVIGQAGAIPWHLPEDMAFFRRTTTGHTVLMGRKTYDSIGRPLPNRRNIVVSRDMDWTAAGVDTFSSIPDALAACASDDEVFVIGGAQVYAQSMPYVRRALVTEIHTAFAGDTFFPALPSDFIETARQAQTSVKAPFLNFDFVVYERTTPDTAPLPEKRQP